MTEDIQNEKPTNASNKLIQIEDCFGRILSLLNVLGWAADHPDKPVGNIWRFVQTVECEVNVLQKLVSMKGEEVQS